MRRGLIVTAVTALVLAAPAAAGLPRTGTLVPGRSLGGVRLGETLPSRRGGARRGLTASAMTARSGRGTSRTSPSTGTASRSSSTHGRVSGVYTLWRPPAGARRMASASARRRSPSTTAVGTLAPIGCHGYDALARDSAKARTVVLRRRREALGIRPLPPRRRAVPVIELADVERAGGTARRRRAPDAGAHLADARRADGASVHVKAECFQRGGAFKFRGAYNKISSLGEDALAAACSPTRPATTRRRSRSRPGSRLARRRSSCPRTRRRRSSTRPAATAPRS